MRFLCYFHHKVKHIIAVFYPVPAIILTYMRNFGINCFFRFVIYLHLLTFYLNKMFKMLIWNSFIRAVIITNVYCQFVCIFFNYHPFFYIGFILFTRVVPQNLELFLYNVIKEEKFLNFELPGIYSAWVIVRGEVVEVIKQGIKIITPQSISSIIEPIIENAANNGNNSNSDGGENKTNSSVKWGVLSGIGITLLIYKKDQEKLSTLKLNIVLGKQHMDGLGPSHPKFAEVQNRFHSDCEELRRLENLGMTGRVKEDISSHFDQASSTVNSSTELVFKWAAKLKDVSDIPPVI
jgi:hypothetical protein